VDRDAAGQRFDPDDVERDEEWNHAARGESELERLDRNWTELLQELRVVQTGVQLLTGFLLTLPFQQRFTTLDEVERTDYLVAVGLAAGATTLLIAPVALHRLLFRRHARRNLVSLAHRLALLGAWLLGLALGAVVLLIFSVTEGTGAGYLAGGITIGLVTGLWVALPLIARLAVTPTRPAARSPAAPPAGASAQSRHP
jgi:hypothetical protein